MCGIAGCINFKEIPSAPVESMIDAIKHRGPDAQKTYQSGPINFGHARLRIMDLDPKADQPFFSNDRNLVVVFNGEIYNFKEIRQELSSYEFKTNCDTEVILAAYEKWGAECLSRFNGMFSFVLFDFANNRAFGARDRFGIKPFYYCWKGEEFLFSSEIKGLLACVDKPMPNYSVIKEYLGTDYCEQRKETFFNDIFQLLPGDSFVFDGGEFKLNRYYDLKDKFKINCDIAEDAAQEKLLELMLSSVKYRVQSDVPVGLYFSGGIDSTAIASLLHIIMGKDKMSSLTAFSEDVSQKERDLINEMACSMGLAPMFCDSGLEDVSRSMNSLMWHMEMPYASSLVCDDSLNRAARENDLVVVLEGQGSDEVQAGYTKYYLPFLQDCLMDGRLGDFIKGFINPPAPMTRKRILRTLPRMLLKDLLKKLGVRRVASIYSSLKKYCLNAINDAASFDDPPVEQPFKSHLHNALYYDVYSKLQRVLRYKDRISMAYSRELRVPFLDYRIIEFMASLPNCFKIKSGMQKVVLRKAFEKIMPQKAAMMPKNHLLKDKVSKKSMRDLYLETEQIISSPTSRVRGLFDIDAVLRDWKRGKISRPLFWKIGQVELWHKIFIDSHFSESKNLAVPEGSCS
ncbi:MAG: asparagine synthase (glutamine-hydrolyzing) [Alphaproteobacteria bacterium]|nr:asparagine synthase (glutamine-hydrolyzing) [Alphaproteobacteria bacterium]